MPTYDAPQNDQARLQFMRTAVNTGTNDIAAGNNYVSQATLDGMNALTPNFETAYNYVNTALSQRSQQVRERDQEARLLETLVRDFWEVLRRRVNRQSQPTALLQQYGLTLDGTTPTIRTPLEWITAANIVVAGDAAAVANGYAAMVNPSAAEVSSQLSGTQAAQNLIAGADRMYDEAQEALAILRPQADALIQETMDELRFNLRKRDTPSRRRIIRTYGGTYNYSPGESPEEEMAEPIEEMA